MSEWKEVQLNETCDLIAGYAFKSKDFGNYPTKVLKIADINPPFVSSEKSSGVDLSNYDVDKLEKYIVKKGDYILAMTGATIGKMGRYVSNEQAYLNQRVLKFKPYKSIDSDFLYYVLCGRLFAKYIINHIDSESAQPNISAGTIGKYRFNLPNFETQQKIASILSSLDSKIENNRKICANLEAQAQALFKHWFIDFAPFKDGKFVESELGMIPEGWRVGTLGEIAEFKRGKTITKGETKKGLIPVVAGGLEPAYYHDKSNTSSRVVTISGSGANAGFTRMYFIPVWASDCSFIDDESTTFLHTAYCYLLINKKKVNALQWGAAQPHVYAKDINKLSLVIATPDVLNHFEELVVPMFDSIELHEKESSRLSTLRDTLLPKLMSGAIKV